RSWFSISATSIPTRSYDWQSWSVIRLETVPAAPVMRMRRPLGRGVQCSPPAGVSLARSIAYFPSSLTLLLKTHGAVFRCVGLPRLPHHDRYATFCVVFQYAGRNYEPSGHWTALGWKALRIPLQRS